MDNENGQAKNKKPSPLEYWGTSAFFIISTIWMLYRKETFGRRGGFTPEHDPIMYWLCILIFGGIGIYALIICVNKKLNK